MLRWCAAVGLLALAGCGGPQAGCSDEVADTAGVRLTYRVNGGPAEVASAAHTLCRRVEGLGEERPALAVQNDRITVVVPKGTPDGVIDYVGTQGRLAFYDWEPVLLDDRCKADPDLNSNSRSPVVGRARAEGLTGKCDARMVRQERLQPGAPKPDAWWLVRGEPVLTGDHVVDPEAANDPTTNEPIVTFHFTDAGRRKFSAMTRAIAERGADNALPGTSPVEGSFHFAIVLDDELISTPFINYAEDPQGISGETGAQISGGFTEQTARLLAHLLEVGPMAVDLDLVERRTQGG